MTTQERIIATLKNKRFQHRLVQGISTLVLAGSLLSLISHRQISLLNWQYYTIIVAYFVFGATNFLEGMDAFRDIHLAVMKSINDTFEKYLMEDTQLKIKTAKKAD